MTQREVIRHWKKSAQRNLLTAEDMVQSGHYDWALFVGQLALEKLLKGLVVKNTNKLPPHIHDLQKLAEVANLELTDKQINDFTEITRFHIQARYDDIKELSTNNLYMEALIR